MDDAASRLGAPRSVVPVSRMSTVDLIVVELRKAILAGDLAVGAPLGEVEIAAQLGVSRGPLREGAQRLVQEGLLVAIPGRGLRVRRIATPAEIAALYEARLAIESHAARRLAQRSDGAVTDELEAALATLTTVSEGTEARPIGDADLEFHRQLVDLVDNAHLSAQISTLLAETRIASLSMPDGYQVRRSVSSTYRDLIDAIGAGDGEGAAEALALQFEAAVARLTGQDESTETVEAAVRDEPLSFNPIEPVE